MIAPFPPDSRLVAYLRDSGGDRQDTSIPQQEQAIGDWCKTNGYLLTHIFKDTARSGTSLAGRDQFLAMIAYLDQDAPERGVVIWEYARLARDYDVAQFYLADLRRRGVAVYSLTDAVPDDLNGRMMEAMINWKNASYSARLSTDIRRGLSYVVTRHHAVLGRVPTGYKLISQEIGAHRDGTLHTISRLAIDEQTAPLVQLAFRLRANGATYREIHEQVHLFPWYRNYSSLFRNPIYTGSKLYNGETIPDFCPPIVDQVTFAAVQAISDQRAGRTGANHPRTVRSRYMLSGLLRCDICGDNMVGHATASQGRDPYLYYRCSTHAKLGSSCTSMLIPKDQIEQRVIAVIRGRVLIPDVLENVYARARAQHLASDSLRQADLQRMRGDVDELGRRVSRIIAAIRDAGHSTALLSELAGLEEQQRQARERLARLEGERPLPLPDLNLDQVASILRQKLETAPAAEVAVILRGFILSISARRTRGQPLTGSLTYAFPPLPDFQITVPL